MRKIFHKNNKLEESTQVQTVHSKDSVIRKEEPHSGSVSERGACAIAILILQEKGIVRVTSRRQFLDTPFFFNATE